MLLACCGTNDSEEQKPKEQTPRGPQPGDYSFVMPADMKVNGEAMNIGKLAWKEGDKICLHSGYGPATQILTLKASEISSDASIAKAPRHLMAASVSLESLLSSRALSIVFLCCIRYISSSMHRYTYAS